MFPFFILLTVLFMKLLMILTELAPGGAEKVVLELTRQLRRCAHDVTVVSLMPEPPEERRAIPEGLSACGAKGIYLNVVKKAPWRLLSLFRVIREEKPDVIHSHLIHPNLLSRFVNLWTRKPLVNTVHIAERRPGKGLFFRLDGLTFSWCGACTAVSKAAARFHEKRCGLKENSIRVIYNGSDRVAPASAEQLRQLKKEWGLEPCRKIIGSVGRLDWQKGYDLLFGVLPELSRRIPRNESVGIVVIGDGPEREKLAAQVRGMEEQCPNLKICLPGYRKDAASLIAMFDLFVMPSRYEGYGLALVEAISSGVPVFCNPVDSLPELCALIPGHAFPGDFEHDSASLLAERIMEALSAPRYEGREIMTNEQMYREYLALYESLLNTKKLHP